MAIDAARANRTFIDRIIAAAALAALADLFFFDEGVAATLGVFGLAWVATLGWNRPDIRRHTGACAALIAAAGYALILIDDPSFLTWCLFWIAIASATLLPLHRFRDALRWGGMLAMHGLFGLAAPVRDLLRLGRAQRPGERTSLGAIASLLALPLIGGAIFLTLFASANPLIANAFAAIAMPDLSNILPHALFWSAVLLLVWPSLRPRRTVLPGLVAQQGPALPHVPQATLVLSLVTFNAIFAVQNLLDLAFLWSDAPLPRGVTLADYAHRGAYPLIATTLLAGMFVLIASRPGSADRPPPLVTRLILLWILQNVLLVSSSILRTLDYIAAYSLTILRISALAWMALVAAGLILICWRMLAGRSVRWLINANAAAAGLVLTAASVVNLGAVAAQWNVRHARSADDLDLCYIGGLGAAALLPLIELERRAGGPVLRDRAAYLRARAFDRLVRQQSDWRRWTWRNARRLAAASAMLGAHPRRPIAVPQGRDCAGEPHRAPGARTGGRGTEPAARTP